MTQRVGHLLGMAIKATVIFPDSQAFSPKAPLSGSLP
jgi:hypothetical protein